MKYEINNKGTHYTIIVHSKSETGERRGQDFNNRNRKYGLKVREEDKTLIIG